MIHEVANSCVYVWTVAKYTDVVMSMVILHAVALLLLTLKLTNVLQILWQVFIAVVHTMLLPLEDVFKLNSDILTTFCWLLPIKHENCWGQRCEIVELNFSNSLIIHAFTSQSGYANLVWCVWFETPMKHWTEAFPRQFDKISNSRVWQNVKPLWCRVTLI